MKDFLSDNWKTIVIAAATTIVVRFTSATLVSQEYHRNVSSSRGFAQFFGTKCKKFKNRSVQNRNTSATASGSVPFFRYACVALRVCFPGSATHFCSFTHFSLKSQTYQKCILLHFYSFDCILCISRFSRTQKRHRALHFCKARCPRFDRFPVSSSLPEPSSGSVRSGPGSWCCGTRTAYRPNVQ